MQEVKTASKIVVIEDDKHLLDYLGDMLAQNNFDVVGKYSTATHVLHDLKEMSAELVLMDIILQKQYNAIETAHKIKKDLNIFVVFFITGNVSKKILEKAIAINPDGYVLKPFKNEELIQTLNVVLQKYDSKDFKSVVKHELQVKSIIEEVGERSFLFFREYLTGSENSLVLSTNTRFNIINQPKEFYDTLINLKKLNSVRRINKFLEAINEKLPVGGVYIGHAETKGLRKKMILTKYPWGINYIAYLIYFLVKRVWPKLPVLKKLYFFITKGRNRAISRAEVLGRLISCGFEIVDERFIDSELHFIVKKVRKPHYDMNASYDLIFKMKRIGKNGKFIYVYKFRTMHPFSEYIQDYIIKKYGYNEAGKPAQDFRLASWGRFLRKYWLDELPQLINVLKGEMKIVGVRPISETRFNEFPEDLKVERIKHKPGCIPPYVALLMPDDVGNIEAERIYFEKKNKRPYTTDIKFFFKAIFNIISNKIKSA